MTGAIIGDIVGSQFRFNTTDVKDNVELFTNECSFTDNTICAVAIADAIMNNGSYQEALLDWCIVIQIHKADTATWLHNG